jgi:3-oxoacyl-[acyl-carrier-protein] synthase II
MKLEDDIVITAFGAITPIGSTYAEIQNSLYNGISGIKKINKFPIDFFITQHAGIPEEGNRPNNLSSKNIKNGELFYAELAVRQLMKHEQFSHDYYQPDRMGCVLGVDEPAVDMGLCFDLRQGYENSPMTKQILLDRMTKHFRLSDCLNLAPSSVLSIINKHVAFSGYSNVHLGLCSASLQAIGLGYQALKSNKLDAVIVGGVSGKVNPLNLARLELMDVISTDINMPPQKRSRPFDNKRSGFVLAEGGILFLLEKRKDAEIRGVKSLLTVAGYGSSMAAQHIVASHKDSREMILAMKRALIDANMSEQDIELINAHGTSTILNDIHESKAISSVFKNKPNVLVTANKSLHGHLIAASGAMEVLNTLISINENFIPGVINLENQDEKCTVNVVSKTLNKSITTVLKNSFGMGGLAASMILKKGDI